MNKAVAGQSSPDSYNVNFLAGLCALEESEYRRAREYFLTALCESKPSEPHYFTYASYLQLLAVLLDYKDGVLQHCQHHNESIYPLEPEIQFNLACSEFIKGNRQQGIQAMNYVEDSDLSESSSSLLDSIFRIVGRRQQDVNGKLSRNKGWSRLTGRWQRKNSRISRERIEELIKDNVRNRYQYSAIELARLRV